jgi:hypothetical protein
MMDGTSPFQDYSSFNRTATLSGTLSKHVSLVNGAVYSTLLDRTNTASFDVGVFSQGQEASSFTLEATTRLIKKGSGAGTPGAENLTKNPHPASTTNWQLSTSGAGGTSTFVYDATQEAVVATVTVQPTDSVYAIRYGGSTAGNVPITQGQRYYGTWEVMSTIPDQRSFTLEWRSSTNTIVSGTDATSPISLPANTWVKMEIFATPAAAATTAALVVSQRAAGSANIRTLGSKLYARKAMIAPVSSDVAVPYFDGSSPGASWTGTANNSTSIMAATGPADGDIQVLGTSGVVSDGLVLNGTNVSFLTKYLTTGEARASYDLQTLRSIVAHGVHTADKNLLYVDGELVSTALITPEQQADKFVANDGKLYSGVTTTSQRIAVNGVGVYGQELSSDIIKRHAQAAKNVVEAEDVVLSFGGTRFPMSYDSRDLFLQQTWTTTEDWNNGSFQNTIVENDRLLPQMSNGVSMQGTWTAGVLIGTTNTSIYGINLLWDGVGATVQASVDGNTWETVERGKNLSTTPPGFNPTDVVLQIRVLFPGGIANDTSFLDNLAITGISTGVNPAVGGRTVTFTAPAYQKRDRRAIDLYDDWGAELAGGTVTISTSTDEVPSNPTTIGMWIKRTTTAVPTINVAGTVYKSGVATTLDAATPLGEWSLVYVVAAAPVTTSVVVSGYAEIGQIAFYEAALTTAQMQSIELSYTGRPSMRINDNSILSIAESLTSTSIYAHDWSITGSG